MEEALSVGSNNLEMNEKDNTLLNIKRCYFVHEADLEVINSRNFVYSTKFDF